MRATTELFLIDGQPMLVPDRDVEVRFEDIDAASAGRDEAGVMHRKPVRNKVGSWEFSYGFLTQQELAYTEALFGNKATFTFTYPGLDGPEKRTCYRSACAITWRNAKTGLWKGYGFRIIEC